MTTDWIEESALAAQESSEVHPRSWAPVDLTAVLDGTWTAPRPTVGKRSDGAGLFYPGKTHTVVSETEGGKTWFALSAALDEMADGNHVVYLDFEDSEGGIVGRLMTLGASRDTIRDRFHYFRPTDPLGSGINLDDLNRVLSTWVPTLGILDGITEAMTLHGLNPLDNTDAAKFGRILPKRLTEAGAAAVNLDHVVKNREGQTRYALGAVHKLNGLDGASYVLENRTPFGVGITGRTTVKIAKDRPAQLRRNGLPSAGGLYWYGDLVLASHGEQFAEVSIEPPFEHSEDFRPTLLMGRIAAALTEHGPLSARKIELAVRGKAASIREALTYMQLDGYVSDCTPHELLKPYSGTE